MPISSSCTPAAAIRSAAASRRAVTHVLFRQNLSFVAVQHVKCSPRLIRSVVKGLRSDTSNGDNGIEPARELLERLFAKTKSLDPSASQDSELSLSIEVLKSEFEAALSVLRKKERDLRDAERKVSLDRSRLNQTKQDLDQREEDIIKAYARQHEMEKALMKASRDLTLQVRQINNLKRLVEEQDRKIVNSQAALSQKVIEVDKLKEDMRKKNVEATWMRSEVKSKEKQLHAANQALEKQETIISELQREIKKKETEIARANELRKADEEKLKLAEQELTKQNLGWIAAQQELKELAQMASKDKDNIRDTIDDFKRVRSLLDVVRSELLASKEAFTFSCQQIEDQAMQLNKQMQELTDQRILLISYTQNLEAAQLEIQEKTKELNSLQFRCNELESQLCKEMERVESLEAVLTKERESLEQKTKEVNLLQEELAQKEDEYCNSQKLVQLKESELLQARHEVEDMRLKVDSIQLTVQEKDAELLKTQQRLAEVNNEVVALKQLINSKDDQLVQIRTELQEKEQCINIMQDELDKVKLGRSQAESMVRKIVELTGNLISSTEGGEYDIYSLLDDEISSTSTALEFNLQKHNQLEADIDTLRESLQQKDMDLRAAYKALDAKDEELKAVVRRLDVRDKELDKLEELSIDSNSTRRLSSLANETIEDNIKVENAEVEALAAAAALNKLAKMTKEFLRRRKTESGTDIFASQNAKMGEGAYKMEVTKDMNVILEAEKEIIGLFSLTKELLNDAVD
ncbi:hypothetical protein QOZ80_2BG0157490 [Eleusine coracana subsp. coracana]|nr:hypothetical protein QOZ80_2BG0157490 [Eleusine coracana subsp. coracana]